MPVAETTAITFFGPMMVVILAGPMLGERIGIIGWGPAIAGFLGVLLIARPGTGLDMIGITFALLAVGANVGYQLLSRLLAATERTFALLFYTALVGSVCFGLALPWFLGGRTPNAWEILLFLSLGVTGGLGHFLFTAAYRHAPASMLAPMNYLQLFWAGILGWIVFGHVPDGASLAGMMIIMASGIAVALKPAAGARRKRSPAPGPSSVDR
jgi:drug/metabolite transporter (DMT)-like permease